MFACLFFFFFFLNPICSRMGKRRKKGSHVEGEARRGGSGGSGGARARSLSCRTALWQHAPSRPPTPRTGAHGAPCSFFPTVKEQASNCFQLSPKLLKNTPASDLTPSRHKLLVSTLRFLDIRAPFYFRTAVTLRCKVPRALNGPFTPRGSAGPSCYR